MEGGKKWDKEEVRKKGREGTGRGREEQEEKGDHFPDETGRERKQSKMHPCPSSSKTDLDKSQN